jgi:hypothetical protein
LEQGIVFGALRTRELAGEDRDLDLAGQRRGATEFVVWRGWEFFAGIGGMR